MTLASPAQLAQLLVQAHRERRPLGTLDSTLHPVDRTDAYLTQREILRLNGLEAGGWKIGSKSPSGPVQGSPLPRNCLFAPGHRFKRAEYAPVGLELEIAFRFKHAFVPREQPYSDEEVLAGIGAMAATIEIVSSRFADFPKVEPLMQLADLLNHGALIVGEFVDYEPGFDFLAPSLAWTFNGENIAPSATGNPCGDPRRLLSWLVNHHTTRGATLPADFVITTGSYTGMVFADTSGPVLGQIAGLPPVSLRLE
ncbi:2-keto-4-pentenoate hydratase [Pseudomonas sp. NPDC090202]|uniref:2-keto-4-pentenoate hydratase n=1 Tax=unclassified Pseudomonas TaxID=196821 RepID=UPI0037F7100C